MANEDHVAIAKQEQGAWNVWRRANPYITPNLSGADLSGVGLAGANLSGVNLRRADLTGTDLQRADLSSSDLTETDLQGADLSSADLTGANFSKANLSRADLSDSELQRVDFSGADLSEANLQRSDLTGANLSNAKLTGTNLREAILFGVNIGGAEFRRANLDRVVLLSTNFSGANFSEADLGKASLMGDLRKTNLSGANLTEADFRNADLSEADLSGAMLRIAIFADCDLRDAKGLERINHYGPSTIGIDTLFKSNGRIPEAFLREVGVPEDFIIQIPSLIAGIQPIHFHSCFISYSHQDEEFSQRLHSQMRAEKLRVWYAPEDMKGGRKLHEEIFSAIQIHDKLLLVLSESSMKSDWVMTEIRRARKVELEENRRKLFPIRLVDFEAIQKWECFDTDSAKDLAAELREYYIPDFSNWKDHDAFKAEFSKLLRDLRATET